MFFKYNIYRNIKKLVFPNYPKYNKKIQYPHLNYPKTQNTKYNMNKNIKYQENIFTNSDGWVIMKSKKI